MIIRWILVLALGASMGLARVREFEGADVSSDVWEFMNMSPPDIRKQAKGVVEVRGNVLFGSGFLLSYSPDLQIVVTNKHVIEPSGAGDFVPVCAWHRECEDAFVTDLGCEHDLVLLSVSSEFADDGWTQHQPETPQHQSVCPYHWLSRFGCCFQPI